MISLATAPLIDLAAEVDAMASYVSARWDNVPDLHALFARIAQEVTNSGRFWFDDSELSSWALAHLDRREVQLRSVLGEDARTLMFFDRPYVLLHGVALSSSTLFQEVARLNKDNPSFERRVEGLIPVLKAEFPKLARAKPTGWLALSRGYADFDGMREYCESQQQNDEVEFKGHRIGSPCAHPFPTATALPFVLYGDKCQGRSSATALGGSAYNQLMAMHRHNATHQICKELEATGVTSAAADLMLDFDLPGLSPLTQALCEVAYARSPFTLAAAGKGEARKLLADCKASGSYEGLCAQLKALAAAGADEADEWNPERHAQRALKAIAAD